MEISGHDEVCAVLADPAFVVPPVAAVESPDLTADHDADLQFGSGLRPCPGRAQALALAAGVLEALRDGLGR
ncbi:MAG: hypothetical protein M3Q31_17980 [Actinomycetota bacterium]|nr:hypothetical protein [Actinomycetota bacterium]